MMPHIWMLLQGDLPFCLCCFSLYIPIFQALGIISLSCSGNYCYKFRRFDYFVMRRAIFQPVTHDQALLQCHIERYPEKYPAIRIFPIIIKLAGEVS